MACQSCFQRWEGCQELQHSEPACSNTCRHSPNSSSYCETVVIHMYFKQSLPLVIIYVHNYMYLWCLSQNKVNRSSYCERVVTYVCICSSVLITTCHCSQQGSIPRRVVLGPYTPTYWDSISISCVVLVVVVSIIGQFSFQLCH